MGSSVVTAPKDSLIENVRSARNAQGFALLPGSILKDSEAIDNTFHGVYTNPMQAGVRITGSMFRNNGDDGLRAVHGAIVEGDIVIGNDGRGIVVSFGSRVTGNVIRENTGQALFTLSDSIVTDNAISENGSWGRADRGSRIWAFQADRSGPPSAPLSVRRRSRSRARDRCQRTRLALVSSTSSGGIAQKCPGPE